MTADQGLRGGRPIHLKKLADAAIDQVKGGEGKREGGIIIDLFCNGCMIDSSQ